MPSPFLQQTVIALAIVQAFAPSAFAEEQAAQPLAEIHVTGSKWVASDRATVAGFSDMPLMQTPASVTAIGRTQMQDLAIRNTSDALKYDASVGDSYNAVGYAEQFSIRGFKLDNAASYRKDGIAISGDTQIPLENKERIEILKGLAGLTAGVATPGGIVNYATKRPTSTDLRSATVEARERGTLYGAVDLGGHFADKRFGYRFNAAGEKLRSYVRGADGKRTFVSGALDWQLTPQALVQLDMDYQHKEQITAPGYQLIRGVALPTGVSPKMLLNDQPWTKPVDTTSSNIGLRFEYTFNNDWKATLSANKHTFKRDDFTAFPYGCSNEGDGFYPGYCSNGDYDVYDYQSTGERKNPFGAQAMLQGQFVTGSLKHALTVGASNFDRSDYFGEYVYDYAGSSNIYKNVIVPPAPPSRTTGPILEQRKDKERAFFAQDIITLSPQAQLHAGARYVQIKRTNLFKTEDWNFLLPSVALTYQVKRDWMVYGSVSHGLQHGTEAPFETSNYPDVLAPSRSKQVEFGVKGAVNDSMTVTAALFQITTGLEYTDYKLDIPKGRYVLNGDQTHRGLELGLLGNVGKNLDYSISLTALDMKQSGTGDITLDGKRPPNVAPLKTSTVIEYALPNVAGLKFNALWQYAGKKAFDNPNTIFVPGYHLFGLGAAYGTRIGGVATVIRANVDNVADKFYWRDVSPLLGGYLLPGAPRTVKVSAQFDF
jgi:iron complex outermembrane receptor protein